jgi:hypothetical protein
MMSLKSALAAFGVLVAVSFMTATTQGAATPLHTNYLTFSAPVALPGVTLPAGTYIFERVEFTNPDVIVVRDRDRSRVYLMARTDRVSRPAGSNLDRLVTFGEARPGQAVPVTAWYPSGELIGHRFIYR